jgi:hypothetical protein
MLGDVEAHEVSSSSHTYPPSSVNTRRVAQSFLQLAAGGSDRFTSQLTNPRAATPAHYIAMACGTIVGLVFMLLCD